MPLAIPRLLTNPFGYIRYHSHQNPALLYSVLLGSVLSPVFLFIVPVVRKKAGYKNAPHIPLTYPSKSRQYLEVAIRIIR